MWIKQIFIGMIGLSAAFIVSAGLFALITAVGIMTRLAGKTHTARFIKGYETAVVLGGGLGNIIYLYGFFPVSSVTKGCLLLFFGLGAGIYVGCLATALSELLNTTAIFVRRSKLTKGIPVMVICVALGKMLGSFLQFYLRWGM